MATTPLSGSERAPLSGSRSIGAADPTESLRVLVVLRRHGYGEFNDIIDRLAAGDTPREHLSRSAFARKFGAADADVEKITDFARRYGLEPAQPDVASGSVALRGTVAQFNAAFGVELHRYEHSGGCYRGHPGALHLPDELHGIVTAVVGLDNRPQARTHFRFRPPFRVAPRVEPTAYLPAQVASLYDFPDGAGKGQCIGIIELGGGYSAEDLQAYFSALGMAPPSVTAVSVDGRDHEPTGDPGGPDGEVMLDIEIAGAIAPEADIAVYFSDNSDAGFIGALNAAVHDDRNRPSVISISWGGPESSWTAQSMRAFNDALKAAAMMGVTVCAASGDSGADDGVADGGDHVDFPAASPYVLACGGTSLRASAGGPSSETVWNDGARGGASGGGVSAVYGLPAWQRNLSVSTSAGTAVLGGRGVPDVAGDADPVTGYRVRIDGTDRVVGGTSAVAPLWAALIARINASKGANVGYVNARLYANPAAFNDITQGGNGGFVASPGWDACTGLGSPSGRRLVDVL